MKSNLYFKNIDFLRFVFILIVCCCHLQFGVTNLFFNGKIPLYDTLQKCFTYSWIPVEFFFIISVFFMFLKTDFSQSFITFAKNKLIRFMPLIWFICGVWFVTNLFIPIGFCYQENIFSLLNIQNVGITFQSGDFSSSWFVSSLFWTMCFYFYLFKIAKKEWFNLITACLIFLCYTLWISNIGIHNRLENVGSLFNIGLARAFAGVGVGYFIAQMYQKYSEKITAFNPNITLKILFTIAECSLISSLIYNTCMHCMEYKNCFILVINFVVLFILFLIKKGYLSQILNNNISCFLGKNTFAIFLTHNFVISVYGILICQKNWRFPMHHPILNLVVLFLIIIIFGILTHYKVEIPATKYLKEKFK